MIEIIIAWGFLLTFWLGVYAEKQDTKWRKRKEKKNAKKLHYSITEECLHPERLTRVLVSVATCETTVEVCADCHVQLSEIKTEC